jgi:membrane associated rhomboid family serine protease
MFRLTPVTKILISINLLIFLLFAAELDGALDDSMVSTLALWPIGPQFMPWQVLTYAFVHAGLAHLAFNMFGVYMFGSELERVWGSRRYLVFYLFCAISAAATQMLVLSLTDTYIATVGASGAVFGLLLGFAMEFPNRVVVPLFPPIPMRAPIFVALYGGLELILGVTGTEAGVAHFAHLGGLAGGFIFMFLWRRRH